MYSFLFLNTVIQNLYKFPFLYLNPSWTICDFEWISTSEVLKVTCSRENKTWKIPRKKQMFYLQSNQSVIVS